MVAPNNHKFPAKSRSGSKHSYKQAFWGRLLLCCVLQQPTAAPRYLPSCAWASGSSKRQTTTHVSSFAYRGKTASGDHLNASDNFSSIADTEEESRARGYPRRKQNHPPSKATDTSSISMHDPEKHQYNLDHKHLCPHPPNSHPQPIACFRWDVGTRPGRDTTHDQGASQRRFEARQEVRGDCIRASQGSAAVCARRRARPAPGGGATAARTCGSSPVGRSGVLLPAAPRQAWRWRQDRAYRM